MIHGWKKAGLGLTLAATVLATAAPADAQRWRGRGYGGGWHYRDRGGDVAAGALLGGILGLGVGAAIASNNRNRYYDRGYYDRGYYDRGYYADRGYAYDRYYAPPPRAYYQPRCWNDWRWDPYWGRNVRVRICD